MKISIGDNFEDTLKKPLEDNGYKVSIHTKEKSNAQVYIGYANEDIHKGTYPNLKAVLLMSAGYDKLNIKRLKKENVKVTNARGIYSEAIAEFVIAQILYSYKDIETLKRNQKEHKWDKTNIEPLSLIDSKIFYLGTGSIASEISKRLIPFKTKNIGFNSDGRNIDYFDKCYPLSELNKHIQSADIIIAALPDNKHTYHLFNDKLFKKIKEGAVFINVGRGSLLNETSIQNNTTHLRQIVLDVFETEPLEEDSYLWDEPNVIVTPHISFISKHNVKNQVNLALDNLENIKNNKELKNRII